MGREGAHYSETIFDSRGVRAVIYTAYGPVEVPSGTEIHEAKRRAKEVWEDTSGGCHRTLLVYPDVIDIQSSTPLRILLTCQGLETSSRATS